MNSKLADSTYSCGEPGYYPDETLAVTYPSPSATSAEQPNGSAGSPVSSLTSYGSSVGAPSQTNEQQGAQPTIAGPSVSVSTHSSVDSSTPDGSVSNTTLTQVLLSCASASTSDAKPMPLSFSYELHRHPLSSSTDAIEDVKTSMLNDIARNVGCITSGRRLSNLRNYPTKTTQDYIVAVQSQSSDVLNKNCEMTGI